MPILYVRDSNGNFVAVPGIIGPRGPQGQGLSAYDAAKEAGYTGTEEEFNAALADIENKATKTEAQAMADAAEANAKNASDPKGSAKNAKSEAIAAAEADASAKANTAESNARAASDPAGSAAAAQTAAAADATAKANAAEANAKAASIPLTQKGVAGGVAELGANGKVPSNQLPELNYDPAGSAAAAQSASIAAAAADATAKANAAEANAKAASDPKGSAAAAQEAAQGYANTAESNARAASDPKGSAAAVQANLDIHAENSVIHITAEERTAWNGKANPNDVVAKVGATMTGALIAAAGETTTPQVRNIYFGTTEIEDGAESDQPEGTLYFAYEE